jgi:RNA polymerase sigma-70 factor (sigma-E family)
MRSDEDEQRRQFNEYFAARRESVRRTAYLMCGDWDWADDLAQLAFLRLASAWHRVREPEALDAFLRTCLVRAYLTEARRAWRSRERVFSQLPDVAGLDDDAENAIRRLVFAEALLRVPPRQRVTLICRYYQGLDVAETAAVMSCSEGTVKSQTARGLAALREVLGDAEMHPPERIWTTGAVV